MTIVTIPSDGTRRTEILETATSLFATAEMRVSLKKIANVCFIDDAFGIASRDRPNADKIAWECDHRIPTPRGRPAREALAGYLASVAPEDIAKITHENALRIFSFDAFGYVPTQLGQSRAQATYVDLGYRASARLRKDGTETVSVLSLVTGLRSAS